MNISIANTADVKLNGTKMLLANGISTFFIKGKPIFSNRKSLPTNPSHCFILCN